MQHFAVLGNHSDLSALEIESVIGSNIQKLSNSIALFDNIDNLSNLQNRLGGTIKIGNIISSFIREDRTELTKHLAQIISEQAQEGKIQFGISVYNGGNDIKTNEWRKKKKALGLEIKKELRSMDRSARLADSRNQSLSAADILKNRILQKGAEIIIIPTNTKILIGITVAIQNIDDWSMRDFDRPARNAKRGMLPPKLARIMVNLAGDISNKIILDPFSGSGTVLMEAGIVGCKKIIGSDILKKATDDTEENLAWLKNKIHLPQLNLYTSSAENLGAILEDESIDVIVTEPFLGNPREGRESIQDIERAISELEKMYQRSFTTLSKLLKKDAVMIIALPVHIVHDEKFEINLKKILKNTNLQVDQKTKNLLYSRPNQFVARRILKLTKE